MPREKKAQGKGDDKPKPKRERLATQVDPEVLQRARDLVWWLRDTTLAEFTEDALRKHCDKLERELERKGTPVPKKGAGKLKAGRPPR